MSDKKFPTDENEAPIESPRPKGPEKGDPADPEPMGDVHDPSSDSYDPEKREDPGTDKPLKAPPKRK